MGKCARFCARAAIIIRGVRARLFSLWTMRVLSCSSGGSSRKKSFGAEFGHSLSIFDQGCCSCGESREIAQSLQRAHICFCGAACSSRTGRSSSFGCTDTIRAFSAEYWSFWFAKIGSGTRILTKMGSCFSSLLGASGLVRGGSRRVPGSLLGHRAAAHSGFSGACSTLLLRTAP